ncbi:hypothetical protein [Microbacterium sp. zg-YB36]|uniref:hypothetical protein n=1 Tax=Microbacterium sp. zg-YB36 TaxID=2969407 RepID=UPI00214B6315|nr:hypothetical protein [Microbacterium sp. zg-YB36]MDL5352167.1 hypothetical protein [Microbacterium sp. zg-YB36]
MATFLTPVEVNLIINVATELGVENPSRYIVPDADIWRTADQFWAAAETKLKTGSRPVGGRLALCALVVLVVGYGLDVRVFDESLRLVSKALSILS